MSENEIIEQIVKIIKPYAKNEEALKNINPSSHFIEDLKINSARLVDIILDIEDAFQLAITDEEAESLLTMRNALDLIAKKKSAQEVSNLR